MRGGSDFWSRRKAGVEAEARAEAEAQAALAEAETAKVAEERPDEEILAELNLPDPDTLEPGDDFSVFLSKAVPQRIQRRALRKLWLSNPVLANLDELVEYGEDYTDAATVVENLQTTYQVGKGMLRHVEAMAAEAEAAEAERAAEELATDNDDAADDTTVLGAVETETETEPEPVLTDFAEDVGEADQDEDLPAETPRRRMRFTFEQDVGGATL